jgi:hypothetical protein
MPAKMTIRRIALLIALALPAHAFASTVDLSAILFAPPTVRAGGTGLWYVGLGHIREATTDWHVVFPIPAGTTLISVTPNQNVGTCVATTASLECSGTTLGPFAEFSVILAVSSTLTQTIHSTVSVTTTDNDVDLSNNQASADTTLFTESYLAAGAGINRVDAKVLTSETVTVSFDAFNGGPDAASDVILDASLPPSAVVLSEKTTFDSCTFPPIRCTAKLLNAYDRVSVSAQVIFTTPGSYGIGSDVSWTNLNRSMPPSHVSMSVEADSPPPTADLAMLVDAQPESVAVGGLVTYSVAVTNAGNAPASGVTVRSPFGSLLFDSSSTHCMATPDLSCELGTIASGGWVTFTVTARPTELGKVSTMFSAATSSAEPHTSNNSAPATIDVTAAPARRRAARH